MAVALEDGEFCSGDGEDVLDEVNAESGNSVPVGHDNLWDASSHALFHQKGESFPFEVDTGRDVGDDFVLWELLLEVCDLALEVILLVS